MNLCVVLLLSSLIHLWNLSLHLYIDKIHEGLTCLYMYILYM